MGEAMNLTDIGSTPLERPRGSGCTGQAHRNWLAVVVDCRLRIARRCARGEPPSASPENFDRVEKSDFGNVQRRLVSTDGSA